MLQNFPQPTQPLVLSYIGLRRAIGMSGLLLPVVLGPIGWLVFGVPLQDNMSSYYHTPLRDVFVGTLFAIGIFLFCYRGYDWIENWTANLGCLAAIGLALLPLDPDSDPLRQDSWVGYMHTVCGAWFFLTLAFYSLYHFPRPQPEEAATSDHLRNLIYRTSGVVILISMAAMGVYLFLLSPEQRAVLDKYNALFWGEWVAVWAFSTAWLTKGHALVADLAIAVLATTEAEIRRRMQQS